MCPVNLIAFGPAVSELLDEWSRHVMSECFKVENSLCLSYLPVWKVQGYPKLRIRYPKTANRFQKSLPVMYWETRADTGCKMRLASFERRCSGRTYRRTDLRTDRPMDGRPYERQDLRTDKPSCRDAKTHLIRVQCNNRVSMGIGLTTFGNQRLLKVCEYARRANVDNSKLP